MGHPLVKLLIIMTKGVIFNEPSFFLTSLVCFGFVLYMATNHNGAKPFIKYLYFLNLNLTRADSMYRASKKEFFQDFLWNKW